MEYINRIKHIYEKVFQKLNQTHQIFHLHCNNLGSLINFDGYNICSSLEVSLIIKEKNKFIKSLDLFPITNIDFKNDIKLEDYNHLLNIYQFDNIEQNE